MEENVVDNGGSVVGAVVVGGCVGCGGCGCCGCCGVGVVGNAVTFALGTGFAGFGSGGFLYSDNGRFHYQVPCAPAVLLPAFTYPYLVNIQTATVLND